MKIYTSYSPEEIWKLYSDVGLVLRSGGNLTSPKLVKPRGVTVRPSDFKVLPGPDGVDYVWPEKTRGMSFATTVNRLPNRGVEVGRIWAIPSRARVPSGLLFNVERNDPEHLLLNVSRRMSKTELIEKLKELSNVMIRTNY